MEKSKKAGPAGKTILIVDDEFGVLEVLEFILSDAGFTVVSALNGQEALARLEETRPDLAIVDFMMPILDGNGVIKAIRVRRAAARHSNNSGQRIARKDNQRALRRLHYVPAQALQDRTADGRDLKTARSCEGQARPENRSLKKRRLTAEIMMA